MAIYGDRIKNMETDSRKIKFQKCIVWEAHYPIEETPMH